MVTESVAPVGRYSAPAAPTVVNKRAASGYHPAKLNPAFVGVGRIIAGPPVVKLEVVVELPPVALL